MNKVELRKKQDKILQSLIFYAILCKIFNRKV